MDKSFNDQELSDIMKEIEALEDDFKGTAAKTASPVLAELADMEETESVPQKSVSLESKRAAPKTTFPENTTSMSFSVQGNLNLELQFDIGGKVVALEVTQAGLSIEMEGGVKFFVPVGDTHKKAA